MKQQRKPSMTRDGNGGSSTNTGGGAGTHPTGGAGSGPRNRRAVALVAVGLVLLAALDELAGTQSPAVRSEPAPASSTSAGAGHNFLPPSRAGGAALVVGPAVHSTTPAVGGERAVFRGTAL